MPLIDEIEKLTPTKKRPTGLYSHAGKLSAFGHLHDQRVKIYQPFNKNQLALRLKLKDDDMLPKVVAHDDIYIVEEFVLGQTLTQLKLIQRIMTGQKILDRLFHWRKIAAAPDFDYIKYIYERVSLDKPSKYDIIPSYINHNDLSSDNIIITPEGNIKIIDNELLACNNGWFLNLKNSNVITDVTGFYTEVASNKLATYIYQNVRKSWIKNV